MRRFSLPNLLAGLVLGVLLVAPASAIAQEALPTYYGLPTANLIIDGAAMDSERPPVIIDGAVYAPIRLVAESLGSTVSWDEATRTVSVESPVAMTTQGGVPIVGSPESEGTPARATLEDALRAAGATRDAAIAVADAALEVALANLEAQYAGEAKMGPYQEDLRAVMAAYGQAVDSANAAYQAAAAAANAAYGTP